MSHPVGLSARTNSRSHFIRVKMAMIMCSTIDGLISKIGDERQWRYDEIDSLYPFAHLHDLRTQAAAESEANQTKTSAEAGPCSDRLPLGVPGGIRTHGLLFRRQAL
jgi:hypothetical protein